MGQYLVTSSAGKAGGIFLFDSGNHQLTRLTSGSLRGITRGGEGSYYAVTGIRRPSNVPTRIFKLWPGSWHSEDMGTIPYRGCHDLRWYHGSFYMTACWGNYIVRLNANLEVTGRMQIAEGEDDVCHVNCLAERNGQIYASIFTLSPGSRSQKRRTPAWATEGKVLKVDFERQTYEVAYEPLAQPHSLTWYEDRLYLLESHTSRLTRLHLESHGAERLAQLTGFVRGLAFGDGEVVVGLNRMFVEKRLRASTIPVLVRIRERLNSFAGLVILDPSTWKIRARIHRPGLEVYDILPISGDL